MFAVGPSIPSRSQILTAFVNAPMTPEQYKTRRQPQPAMLAGTITRRARPMRYSTIPPAHAAFGNAITKQLIAVPRIAVCFMVYMDMKDWIVNDDLIPNTIKE
jgi:hypothetical protein